MIDRNHRRTLSISIMAVGFGFVLGTGCDRRPKDCPECAGCPEPKTLKPCDVDPDPLEPAWAAECIAKASTDSDGITIVRIEKCAEMASWLYRNCVIDL